jgi:DNA-binding SARP family transcriptional activator
MRGDTRRGLALFDQAIENLSQAGITNQLALALVRRSGAHRLLGEYTEALGDAEEALWLTGQNPTLGLIRAEACRAKGITLYQQGQLKEALHWLTQSESSYRALEDGNNSAKLLLEIGIVNKASGNLIAAEQAYARALEHWEKTSNSVWQANLLNNLGVLQHMRGDYVTAASNFERAIQHAKISSYPRLEAFALTSIGDLYRDLDAPQESLEAYQQARQIAQRIKDRYLIYYLNLAEGVLARVQKQMDHARETLNLAREMAGESGSQGEQNLCRLETAVLDLATRAYPLAESSLESALVYFKQEGQQAEALRASFYLALVCGAQKNCSQATAYFKQLSAKLEVTDERAPLITAAREFVQLLHTLKREPELAVSIGSLLDQIDQFEVTLPALRTQVRRRASVVPFAPPRMVIRGFGRIEVKIDERMVSSADWQTQTARDLFFFILAHPEGLTKESIGLVFWPESSPAELKLRFKNTVYRLRHAAGRDVILFQDEIYRFNINMDYEYDVESFLKEIDLAQKSEETQQKIVHCKTAIQNYKGTFLPEVAETWVVTERERLYQLYIDALVKLAGLYLETRQHEAALEASQVILRDDPCMEAAHRLAMRILAAMGNRAAMVRQYELCKQALKEEYDAAPSPQTEQLYAILTR